VGWSVIVGLIKSNIVTFNCSGTSNITICPTPLNITSRAPGITYTGDGNTMMLY